MTLLHRWYDIEKHVIRHLLKSYGTVIDIIIIQFTPARLWLYVKPKHVA